MCTIVKNKFFIFLTAGVLLSVSLNAQTGYKYSVDLNNVQKDELTVELLCPQITEKEIVFYLPKIVPGTYMNSDYGKYVSNLKAFTKAGKELPATKAGDNSWIIKKAKSLHKITYNVDDTWYSEIKNTVYPMCGTNFEAGKNFVINTCGLFGYFEGMKKMPFELSFTKPLHFYAATGLTPVSTSADKDVFNCSNADQLYDSPIMFSLPDTATIKVGNADILVAVYSPKKLATAKFIASHLEQLLMATKDYLGGKLPVDKYAFIYYMNSEQPAQAVGGAWEHSYSSFYSLQEMPQEQAIDFWMDISSHEFFHIVTPLTICSKEVREFNFNETVLSKHLWLYEGSTEYYAHHVQVKGGIITPEKFLATLSKKITNSRLRYKDSLSFTELSLESAGKWKDEYQNVYEKGALISACLDLELLQLSNGQYSLQNLKHDLGVKYGKEKYFEDNELFDVIGQLTYPEIKQFLLTHVEGVTPIPYEKYFALAGVDFMPKATTKVFTLGGISISPTEQGKLVIGTSKMNEFGKKMGYKNGDELISLNGTEIDINNGQQLMKQFTSTAKEGDNVEVVVKRKKADGEMEAVVLSAPAMQVEKTEMNQLKMNENATPAQLMIRKAWLQNCK